MRKDLLEIYRQMVLDTKDMSVGYNPFRTVIISDFITPGSDIEAAFGASFQLDQNGMEEIIQSLTENPKVNIEELDVATLFNYIDRTITKYFGGYVDERVRKDRYGYIDENDEYHPRLLSEMKGNRMGACIERACIAHNILKVLKKAGIVNYESSVLESAMSDGKSKTSSPHAFLLLSNSQNNRNILFDIENPVDIRSRESGEIFENQIALYTLTEKEMDAIKKGKKVHVKSIYEELDCEVTPESQGRIYGKEDEYKGRDD